MVALVVFGAAALVLGVASLVAHRRRAHARVALRLVLLASPVVGAGVAISRWEGATFASYLALVPVAVIWACVVDARGGFSDRVARTWPRSAAKATTKAP